MLCDSLLNSSPAQADDRWILIKRAGMEVKDITAPFRLVGEPMQRLLGGPNALTRTLVGGALGGLGGYAAGSVYDAVAPRIIGKGPTNMRGALSLLGAGAGSVPGLVSGGVALANDKSTLSDYPWDAIARDFDVPEYRMKAAEDAGSMMVPSIPVDAFNKVVWNDAMDQNPFGAKSSWGDTSPSLHTPPAAAAAVSGLLSATGAAHGKEIVSPWDVAKTVANLGVNAGIGGIAGLATGAAVGKGLSILAGLPPETQALLQHTGMWSGMIAGIANKVF